MPLHSRSVFSLIAAGCFALLAVGLYLQHEVGLEPCPMCILQRYAYVAIACVALVGALHGPGRNGTRVYAALTGGLAIAGGSVAAQQSRLQLQPPSLAECGPGFGYMVDSFGLSEALPMIFRGAGDCAADGWRLMGLSVANWSLLLFALLLVVSLVLLWRGARKA